MSLFEWQRRRGWDRSIVVEEVDSLRRVVGVDMILVEVGGGLRRGFVVEGIGLGEEGLHRGLLGVDIDLEGDIQIDCMVVVVVEDIPLDREEDIVLHREQVVVRHIVDILVVEVLRTVLEVVPEEEDILLEDPGNTTLKVMLE